MSKNLSNIDLLAQITKNNPEFGYNEAAELLKLNRKFTYWRSIDQMMSTIYKQNKIKTMNSDDFAIEIAQKLENSLLRKANLIENEKDEQDYYRLLDLIALLGGEF